MKTKRNVPARAMQVYKACAHVSKQDRPYLYGGGHAKPLERIAVREGLDCSSSIALALHRVGMFPNEYAIVSGLFAREWGQPGRGKYFTVWANAGHEIGRAHV